MKKERIIQTVVGGGATTKIITLSKEIRRNIGYSNTKVIHYHQLIWDTAKSIGMPLSLNKWNQYQDKFIFEKKKQYVQKYSKIFVDINSTDLEKNWIEILKRYFLEEDGEIYKVEKLIEGQSFRFNNSIAKFINNFYGQKLKIMERSNSFSTYYIPTNKSNIINNIINILKSISKKSDVTILSSNLEHLKFIEQNLEYQKHLSFVTNKEENDFIGTSLDFHWLKKNRSISFNPNRKKLKMATIESFKGLESEIIFFVLTDDILDDNSLHAITRAKNKLYIFNENYENSDRLRLNVDEIIRDKKRIESKEKIYLALLPNIKEEILKIYFNNDYISYRDITLDRDNQILNRFNEKYALFFKKIFPFTEQIDIYNYKKYKGKQQLAITHNDTNIVLIVEQSQNKEKTSKDNYLLCTKIENKDKFILEKSLEKNVKIIVPERVNKNEHTSNIDISELMKEIEEYPIITPISDTPEYKKWEVYLEILEKKLMDKSESFKVNIEFDNNIATFKRPKNKNLKFKKEQEILLDDEKNSKFGKILDIKKDKIIVELDNSFKKDNQDNNYGLLLNYIGDKAQLDILKRGLKDIKVNDFRFYIFGNQKLTKIENWEELNIKFRNKSLNNKQKESIKKALASEKMFMIQGPPGTGKTSVISEIAYQEIIKGNKILISSESNDAIENALERLNEDIFYPILYQSVSRQKNSASINLPIENDIGNFYKQKILKKIKYQIDSILNIEDEINSIKIKLTKLKEKVEKQIESFKEIEDDDDLIQNYIKQKNKSISKFRKEYREKALKYKNKIIFLDIQKEFCRELLDDRVCESELKEIYSQKTNIIGATLNQIGTVAKKSNNSNLFDVVIIDEVSKATPIELNLAILKAKKIILVGDQKQLPPMLDREVTLEEFADKIFRNSEEYESKQEVKKELHEHKTVFEKLIENNPHAYTQLTTQYRMHENIQKAINQFYDEDLKCGLDNETRKNRHKLFNSNNLIWIDTSSSKENKIGTSFENIEEVTRIEKILKKLDEEYIQLDNIPTIGVISFYGKQVNRLSNIKNNFKNIKVDFGTVDTFQGQERDFIVVSMVRSNKNCDIGFARSLNRINVAFSRAKQLLIIVGSNSTFSEIKKSDSDDIKKAKEIYKKIYDMSFKGTLS